jgi:hypothetical protein
MNKSEQYEWAKPGDKGRRCDLRIDELKIDYAYQRPEVSEANTLAIARNFRWDAFGILVVMERDNGNLYVVDGHQRLCAVKRRGDIMVVPCFVFKSDGPRQEAQAFIWLNQHRRYVTAVAKFRAAVMSGAEPEITISAWLGTRGLAVRADGKENHSVDFPANFIKFWKVDAEASKTAIDLQREINGDDPLCASLHKGLWYLLHHGVDVHPHVAKIIKAGGKARVEGVIRGVASMTGQRAMNANVCGAGILSVINHKRKNRIAIPDAEAM